MAVTYRLAEKKKAKYMIMHLGMKHAEVAKACNITEKTLAGWCVKYKWYEAAEEMLHGANKFNSLCDFMVWVSHVYPKQYKEIKALYNDYQTKPEQYEQMLKAM